MTRLSYSSLQKISTILLALCVTFFTISICFLVYFLSTVKETKELQAKLLSQQELQDELLKAQPLQRAVYPHVVKDIGYVLNPFMKQATWHTSDENPYPINALGLRGAKIRKKKKGVTRVLVVGSSPVFGNKLKEEEKLSSVLNQYVADKLSLIKLEFLTIALPNWNTRNERAFLESHLDLLAPDFIIWAFSSRDAYDSGVAFPPGILALRTSSQNEKQVPFTKIVNHFLTFLPMPTVLERWDNTIPLIQSFNSKYRTPVLILHSPPNRTWFDMLLQRSQCQLPYVIIPRKYRSDKSWKVTATDGHPSAWANKIMAAGLLDKLSRLGIIPKMEFASEELNIIQAFRQEEENITSEAKREQSFKRQFDRIPTEYVRANRENHKGILYGLDPKNGVMKQQGLIFLRAKRKFSFLRVRFKPLLNAHKYPRKGIFTIRDRDGSETRQTITIDAQSIDARIRLPESADASTYELSWDFDFTVCRSPLDCVCAELLSMQFEK